MSLYLDSGAAGSASSLIYLATLDLLFCPDPALRRRVHSSLQQYLWLTVCSRPWPVASQPSGARPRKPAEGRPDPPLGKTPGAKSSTIASIALLLYASTGVGAGVMVARAFGRKDLKEVSQIASTGQALSGLLGLLTAFVLVTFSQPLLRLVGRIRS